MKPKQWFYLALVALTLAFAAQFVSGKGLSLNQSNYPVRYIAWDRIIPADHTIEVHELHVKEFQSSIEEARAEVDGHFIGVYNSWDAAYDAAMERGYGELERYGDWDTTKNPYLTRVKGVQSIMSDTSTSLGYTDNPNYVPYGQE